MLYLLSAQDEFEQLSARSSNEFMERTLDLAAERWKYFTARGTYDVGMARQRLGSLVAGTSAVAEMLGRRRVRLEADHMKRGYKSLEAMKFAAEDQNLIPNVPPEKAIEDLVKRDPRLAPGYRRVQELYNDERAFALARSADVTVTKKVQDVLQQSLQAGANLPSVENMIAQIGGWARAYGEVVFRTNLCTAYANGRFLEASDPDLEGFIVGLERMEVMDVRTRPGHAAANGLKAGLRDPIWLHLGVPGGYNCRGTYRLIDKYEAQREGLLYSGHMQPATWPEGAHNDEGFDDRVSFSLMGVM